MATDKQCQAAKRNVKKAGAAEGEGAFASAHARHDAHRARQAGRGHRATQGPGDEPQDAPGALRGGQMTGSARPFEVEPGRTSATNRPPSQRRRPLPDKRPSVKNEKQYEALKDKGMSKEWAAKIANSPGASSRGGKRSGSGGSAKQGGTAAQKKEAGRKGGRATARKS